MSAVTMFHPKSQQTQRASQAAFEHVWSKEGWVLREDPAPAAPAGTATPAGPVDHPPADPEVPADEPPADPAGKVDEPPADPVDELAAVGMPQGMSVPTTLEWVGTDLDRAAQALAAEQAAASPRATLVDRLEKLLA